MSETAYNHFSAPILQFNKLNSNCVLHGDDDSDDNADSNDDDSRCHYSDCKCLMFTKKVTYENAIAISNQLWTIID